MNTKQYNFLAEYLRTGDQVQAYKNAYRSTANYNTMESMANRLLKNREIAAAIHNSRETVSQQVEEQLAARPKARVLSIEDKRELLCRIATGDIYVEQHYKGKNCSQCSQYIRPTINQMLAAIKEDNKLAGHYPVPSTRAGEREKLKKQNTPINIGAKQLHTQSDAEKNGENIKKTQQNTTNSFTHKTYTPDAAKENQVVSHAGLRKLLSSKR